MKKLIQIQSELKVPKTNFNSFGKYKYRSAEDILEAVKPILKKHDCLLFLSDEIKQIGQKYFLLSSATIINGEESKVSYGYSELDEHKGMSKEQSTGTSSSYARKYALNGLFLIDETVSDPDSQEPKKEAVKIEEPKPMTEEQRTKLIFQSSSDCFTEEEKKNLVAWVAKNPSFEKANNMILRGEKKIAEHEANN